MINAGIGDPTLAADFQADQFQRIIDVNLRGLPIAWRLCFRK